MWAHRGDSVHHPENTVEAFEAAVSTGADGVELDVQLSRDRRVVVCHDETLERVSNGHGLVGAHTWAQLRRLDVSRTHPGSGRAAMPLLDEVLEAMAPTGREVNVELKNHIVAQPGLAEEVLSVVADHAMDDRVVLSSFNHRCLARMATLGRRPRLAVLLGDDIVEPWRYARQLGVEAVHPRAAFVLGRDDPTTSHRGDLARYRREGLRVRVWTVDRPVDIRRAAALGVDTVMTNDPARALWALGRGRPSDLDDLAHDHRA